MKKIIIILLVFALFPKIIINVKAENSLIEHATNGILMEVSTKTIIYEKNIHERVSIASLTKMVGLILIFEQIENGSIRYNDKVNISSNASGMGGSQIYLSEGEIISVEDVLKGIIMASANDGIVAMAEKVAGTEIEFVKLMNKKAKELGLRNTNFVNCTGLDENNHYSSAYDLALTAIELMKHEDIFKFTTLYEDYLRENTPNKFWLVNTNKLIRTYNGADGLKTGMTDLAGYCMAVTAKRNGMRLLAIVLGEQEGKIRNSETAALLDYGFNLYEIRKIKNRGEEIGKIDIDKATLNKIPITVLDDVTILKKQSDQDREIISELKLNNIELPLRKGDVIGKLLLKEDNRIIREVDIVTDSDISKTNFFNLLWNIFKSILSGNIT